MELKYLLVKQNLTPGTSSSSSNFYFNNTPPSTLAYPKKSLDVGKFNPRPPILFKINFNSILASVTGPPKSSLSFKFLTSVCIHLASFPHTLHSDCSILTVFSVKLLSLYFLQPPVASSGFRPNIFFSTSF